MELKIVQEEIEKAKINHMTLQSWRFGQQESQIKQEVLAASTYALPVVMNLPLMIINAHLYCLRFPLEL